MHPPRKALDGAETSPPRPPSFRADCICILPRYTVAPSKCECRGARSSFESGRARSYNSTKTRFRKHPNIRVFSKSSFGGIVRSRSPTFKRTPSAPTLTFTGGYSVAGQNTDAVSAEARGSGGRGFRAVQCFSGGVHNNYILIWDYTTIGYSIEIHMNKSVYSRDYRDIIERLKIARIEAGMA